jgi:hypothetical protein
MWVPSLSFALGPVQRPQQERPGPIRVVGVESGRRRFATVGNWLANSARGSWRAERRRSHRKWHAGGGLVACHVWAREEDGVAAFPTPRRKDCLGKWFSSIQFITREVLCPFPKHALILQPHLCDIMRETSTRRKSWKCFPQSKICVPGQIG